MKEVEVGLFAMIPPDELLSSFNIPPTFTVQEDGETDWTNLITVKSKFLSRWLLGDFTEILDKLFSSRNFSYL